MKAHFGHGRTLIVTGGLRAEKVAIDRYSQLIYNKELLGLIENSSSPVICSREFEARLLPSHPSIFLKRDDCRAFDHVCPYQFPGTDLARGSPGDGLPLASFSRPIEIHSLELAAKEIYLSCSHQGSVLPA